MVPDDSVSAPGSASSSIASESGGTETKTAVVSGASTLPAAFMIGVGSAVGRYVVLEELGKGGMGRVLRAYDPKLQREVALKEVRSDRLAEETVRRLVAEARAMAKLSHPNVVAVFDVEELGEEQVVLVMEYVSGVTLKQWLKQERRSWRAVVDCFVAVGRGLAAAHAAGWLHRDFKPANVLVSDQGPVKVTDFGLAKVDGTAESGDSIDVAGESEDLTEAGVVMGTPRYMAPEQYRVVSRIPTHGTASESSLSPAVDQYAFCVALWEALAGEPPFAGKQMLEQKRAGPPEGPRTTAPRFVIEAVRRGLAPEPSDRWPSMQALLDVLGRDPNHRRSRWVLGLSSVAAVLGAGALGQVWMNDQGSLCGGAQERLAGIWDDARRAEVEAAMLGLDAAFATAVWERTAAELDRYAAQWAAMHTQTCEATSIRGEQSTQVMDLRMACLHRLALELEAATDVLANGDADVVRKAHRVVGALRPTTVCADVEALQADVEPPPQSEAPTVERVRALVALAKARHKAGNHQAARTTLEQIQPHLEGLTYEPIRAEIELQRGIVLHKLASYDEAETSLREALRLASKWRQIEQMRSSSIHLMNLLAEKRRPEQAMAYLGLATGLSEGDVRAEASVRGLVATLRFHEGKFEEAEAGHREVLEMLDRELGPEHPETIGARNNIAACLDAQGEAKRAEAEMREVLRLREGALGPEHPDVAEARNNLGISLLSQGRFEEARAESERALALIEATLGPSHPEVARISDTLGNLMFGQGKYAEALEQHQRALTIVEQAFGLEHPRVAIAKNNVANALWAQGNNERAEAEYRAALGIRERTLGPEHPEVAASYNNLGAVLHAQGKLEDAIEAQKHALELWTKLLGPEHPDVALGQHNLAYLLIEHGKFDEALPLAENAWLRLQADPTPKRQQGDTAFVLARALWEAAPDQRTRAQALIERALESYEKAEGDHTARIDFVRAWRAEHR